MTKLQEEYLLEILGGNLRVLEYGLWIGGIVGNGLYKRWYENGQMWAYYSFKNGKLNGEYKCWYDNGRIGAHSFWKNGNLHGEYKEWYENGQINVRRFYKNGKILDIK